VKSDLHIQRPDLVIPTYNSTEFIAHSLRQVLKHREIFSKIIVVNDASTDATLSALESFKPNIEIISTPTNQGQHHATIEGLKVTSSPYVFTLDDDLPVRLVDLPYLLQHAIREEADLIYASYRGGGLVPKIGSWVVSKIMSLKYRTKVTGSSTRLIHRRTLNRCFEAGFSHFLDHDLLAHASICEFVPLVHQKSQHPSRYSFTQRIALFNQMLQNR